MRKYRRRSMWGFRIVYRRVRVSLRGKAREFNELKKEALARVMEKIEKINSHYNFKINRVTIRNQKTRWGSCSKKGNLNFHYKIARLPDSLADYLVAHELCHLGEFNHSKKFWDLVSKTIPDFRERRRQMKRIVL